jgi:outer membrane protein assembly factor BamB
MLETTYLELSEAEGSAHKFYEVTLDGSEVRVRFGRIGTPGQIQSKTYATPEQAKREAEKKLNEKRKKGYESAVVGVRQRRFSCRDATRTATPRPVASVPSTVTQRSPILWRFESGSAAFGIFIDANHCWLGNQDGQVYKLDHQGQILNRYQLPQGVKCIVEDDAWIYVGCDDGNVYDLTGKMVRLAYEIDPNVDIYWLDIHDGVLAVSDANGGLSKADPEGEVQWTRLSAGKMGWMVRCDDRGFYHGHQTGVTFYDREAGRQIWHQATEGAVLFGWQEATTVYAGTSAKKFYSLDKATGAVQHIYKCDASVYSCATAAGGTYLFAGDSSSSIYCFSQKGDRRWKFNTGCGSALSMQFWNDRLYLVTTEGTLACVDASPTAVSAAQGGQLPQTVTIQAAAAPAAMAPAPVTRSLETTLETTTDTTQGVIVECVRQGQKLRIRALSPGYHSDWMVQFPRDIREEGAKYLVEELREARQGGFYRAYGDIKKLL